MGKQKITHERLRELLHYNSEDGLFTWIITNTRVRTGTIAGTRHHKGYVVIHIDGMPYLAHRLAWFYFYNVWPTSELDHKDQDKVNNRINNLRPVTSSQNQQNKGMRSDNTSGFRGVSLIKKSSRWLAQIRLDHKLYRVGLFDTPEEASAASQAAAEKLHTHRPET